MSVCKHGAPNLPCPECDADALMDEYRGRIRHPLEVENTALLAQAAKLAEALEAMMATAIDDYATSRGVSEARAKGKNALAAYKEGKP